MANNDVLEPEPPEHDGAPAPETPHFEEGFTLKTIIGAIFIALFMLPGGLYLGLVAGQGVGDAATWVTIVLFAEVARRSYSPLKKQEIYILFYVAASLTTVINVERGLGGGPFANLIWNAYFASSPVTKNFAHQIPAWAIPSPSSSAIMERRLWDPAWFAPIALLIVGDICGRLSWMGLGYALYRVTNDVEQLPFPLAPVAASGATALSEAGSESWRWSVFSTGTVLGLLFGVLYIAIPVVTGTLLGKSFQILPIPFADYTQNVQRILPGAIVGLSFSLGNILYGMVLPYEIVAGTAAASIVSLVVMNPILYKFGMLPNLRLGSDAMMTKLSVDMDFWLSVTIGTNLSIAFIGIALVWKAFAGARKHRAEKRFSLSPPPPGRGDIPMYVAISAWLGATMVMIGISHWLVPNFPLWILLVFGLLWSPLNSYISARMMGLTGRGVSFLYLKEASVVAVGYPRMDIWFAPIPIYDHGWVAQRFKEVELTGTKFTGIFKAEALMFVIVIPASFLFWAFFWNTNAVPSGAFPYVQRFWPIQAQMQAVMMQINTPRPHGEVSWFAQAIRPTYIAGGAAGGLILYGIANLFKMPLLFYYGFMSGIGQFPAYTLPQLLGAWFGRRYMAKRYGIEQWQRYAPVLLAGFSCGTGLIGMASISLALIAKAVAKLPY